MRCVMGSQCTDHRSTVTDERYGAPASSEHAEDCRCCSRLPISYAFAVVQTRTNNWTSNCVCRFSVIEVPDMTECAQMKVTRTDDDGDVFVESKFAAQCYSENPKHRAERNHRSRDRNSARLIQLCNFVTRSSDDGFRLGRVEKVVSDMPSDDCIGTFRKCCQSGWWCRSNNRLQLCVGEFVFICWS